MAYRGHIVVPTEPTGASETIARVERSLTAKFGGYSKYEGSGGWENPETNTVEEEDHVRIVTIFEPEDHWIDYEGFKEYLRIEAEAVKIELGEETVLIEFEETDVEYV